MKKIVSVLLALCLLLCLSAPALAVTEGEQRVVIGADLTQEQVLSVYSLFGLTRGTIPELYVTNGEERDYLEGLVGEDVIGHKSISCVYIRILPAGSGLSVTCSNVTWCTEDMYRAALMTAGIFDAQVMVGAPFEVSGTAALTGIYKAYENITGSPLQQAAKTAATDELVVTAQLADQISDADAVSIVGELKTLLDETSAMADDQLRSQILSIAGQYGYTLDEASVSQLISLCRTLEGLSANDLEEKVTQLQDTLSTFGRFSQKLDSFGDKLVGFLGGVFGFFRDLFGG